MKKLLLLIHNGFPHQAFDFAIELAKNENFKLNAVFIKQLSRKDKDAYPFPSDINTVDTDFTKESDEEEELLRQKNEQQFFVDKCKHHNLAHHLQIIREDILETIVDETAFADLVLCNDDMDVELFSMNNFISSAHCPVLLIPAENSRFNTVIFMYDGHVSSIHAMKQFTYLFPWAKLFKVHLVSVLTENAGHMEYDALVREWISLHYSQSEIVILKGDAKAGITDFVNKTPNCLVVMGAFGRSALSKLFKDSLAPAILKNTRTPLFISHT